MDTYRILILTWTTLLVLTSLLTPSASGMTSEEAERVTSLEQSVKTLWRQLMLLQLSQQEMRRSDGDSGIKQVRLTRDGTRSYHTNTHTGTSMAAIHDHADMRATCGMGEFEAVLNGVHFRTRHNDYPLRMPASTEEYHATEDIPFPAVPPAVLQNRKLEDQIDEMREWFRAWRDDDISKRDYRPYFKPLLCYLEGTWTTDKHLDEPFLSHRHRLDAAELQQLQDKIIAAGYTGDKHLHENLAYLPSMVLNVTEGAATIAQWNYRILCHPIKQEVRLRDLQPVEDLANRLAGKHRWRDYVMSRAARFTLNPSSAKKIYKWNILDKIMKEIPGMNNYGARLMDQTEAGLKLNAHNSRPLNTAYYHRWYKLPKPGAMGQQVAHTGFADRNLFVAETTQPRVAPMKVEVCPASSGKPRKCRVEARRVSYAIPLEIVFLTPLHAWNPYRLQYKGGNRSPLGQTVVDGGRTGLRSVGGAFNGTNSRHFYQTPDTFFQSGKEVRSDPADTVRGIVGVLDTKGHVRSVVASGVRVLLPKIEGLGVLRTRYPIMPVYAEGSTVWKEVEALRELVMEMDEHKLFFKTVPSFLTASNAEEQNVKNVEPQVDVRIRKVPASSEHGSTLQRSPHILLGPGPAQPLSAVEDSSDSAGVLQEAPINIVLQDSLDPLRSFPDPDPPSSPVVLVTSPSTRGGFLHVHTFELSAEQRRKVVKDGGRVKVRTTLGGGHSHLLEVGFDPETQYFVIHSCDGHLTCLDGHSANLEKVQHERLLVRSQPLFG